METFLRKNNNPKQTKEMPVIGVKIYFSMLVFAIVLPTVFSRKSKQKTPSSTLFKICGSGFNHIPILLRVKSNNRTLSTNETTSN